MAENSTDFQTKCNILADLWLNYRSDEEFLDFVKYNDLGLPLAYALSNNVVGITKLAQEMVEETWDLLLAGLGIQDEGFETLDDLLA